jgi:hypothetical protein
MVSIMSRATIVSIMSRACPSSHLNNLRYTIFLLSAEESIFKMSFCIPILDIYIMVMH